MRRSADQAAVSCFLMLTISGIGLSQVPDRPIDTRPAIPITTTPITPITTTPITTTPIDTGTIQAPPKIIAQQPNVVATGGSPPRLDVDSECLAVELQCNSACPVNHYLGLTPSASARAEYSGCLSRVCHTTGPEHCKEALGKALLEVWHERHDK